jgi:hypothetical protein
LRCLLLRLHQHRGKLRDEIAGDMRLMGVTSPAQLDRSMLRWR